MPSSNQQRFIQSQIAEIRRYLAQFPDENPDAVVMRWIEERASKYRKNWEAKQFN